MGFISQIILGTAFGGNSTSGGLFGQKTSTTGTGLLLGSANTSSIGLWGNPAASTQPKTSFFGGSSTSKFLLNFVTLKFLLCNFAK